MRIVNGMPDRVHCLFGINPQKSVTDIIKQIKGSSSHFVNSDNLIPEFFFWQHDFGVFGVSHSAVDNVYRYIRDQKYHHQKQIFETECINSWNYMGLRMSNYVMIKSLKRL